MIETILLYNAHTWTLADSLERQLDAAHAALQRAAFVKHYSPTADSNANTSNEALYRRAQLCRPSQLLRARRLQLLVGRASLAEQRCPEPLQDVLLLSLQRPGEGK